MAIPMHIIDGPMVARRVRRWHRGWDRMWGEIAEAYGDASCLHDGEAWQYMGTYEDSGRIVHEFRHRSLNGKRTLHHVPAETGDWTKAREPTAEEIAEVTS